MQVLETIKRTMNVILQLENTRSVVSLLISLRSRRVGTGDVESCSRKMCARIEGKSRALVGKVITWKIRDTIGCRREAQYQNTKVRLRLRSFLRKNVS